MFLLQSRVPHPVLHCQCESQRDCEAPRLDVVGDGWVFWASGYAGYAGDGGAMGTASARSSLTMLDAEITVIKNTVFEITVIKNIISKNQLISLYRWVNSYLVARPT